MSEQRPTWSRRKLLRYGSVGLALGIAGCGGAETDPSGSADDGSDDSGPGGLPDDPATAFELSGDGAAQYRDWLVPEHTLDADLDVDTKQLYQFNDYRLAADQEWDAQLQLRDYYAETLGVDPDALESEILVGPVRDGRPRRILFGSFDTAAVTDTLEGEGLEQTAEDGEFTVFDGLLAVSENVIFEHASYEQFLETVRGDREAIGDVDDDVRLLLDLVPRGVFVTLSRREGDDDLVVDAMSVSEIESGIQSRAVRTFVFADGTTPTEERIRELVVENSVFEEIVTEERQGRVAMVEVRR